MFHFLFGNSSILVGVILFKHFFYVFALDFVHSTLVKHVLYEIFGFFVLELLVSVVIIPAPNFIYAAREAVLNIFFFILPTNSLEFRLMIRWKFTAKAC